MALGRASDSNVSYKNSFGLVLEGLVQTLRRGTQRKRYDKVVAFGSRHRGDVGRKNP